MNPSSRSSSSTRRNVWCDCGIPSPLRVSSSSVANPGKRFYGCANYHKGNQCKFFRWERDLFPELYPVEENDKAFGPRVEVQELKYDGLMKCNEELKRDVMLLKYMVFFAYPLLFAILFIMK